MIADFTDKTRMMFFGCSFTAGSELVDHELLGISFDECNKLKHEHTKKKRGIGEFQRYVIRTAKIDMKEYIDLGAVRAYGFKLCSKLGMEFKNYAVGGDSVENSLLSLYTAFCKGEIDPKTDVIFLGVTTPHRYMSFDERGVLYSRVMSHENPMQSDYHYNDYKILQIFYHALEAFKNFCIVHDIQFIIQPIVHKKLLFPPINNHKSNLFANLFDASVLGWEYLSVFDSIKNGVFSYEVTDKELVFGYDPQKDGICGFGHPTEKAHITYSGILYDAITSSRN